MPHRCTSKTGSFGAHLDELVKHFPRETKGKRSPARDSQNLKEKRDIHALLFERAWELENSDKLGGR